MTPAEKLKQEALVQITAVDRRFREISAKVGLGPDPYHTGVRTYERSDLNAMCLSTIERIAGSQHAYSQQARAEVTRHGSSLGVTALTGPLYGIVCALRRDVENDYLVEFSELEHANLFGDFLEMADYLLDSSFKDPAAVLIGGVLEGHLRQLCIKAGLPVSSVDGKTGKDLPHRAEQINTDLKKSGVYSLLDQKAVTGWLDLRNKAAHANYSEYDKSQVEQFSQWVKWFMQRYPA